MFRDQTNTSFSSWISDYSLFFCAAEPQHGGWPHLKPYPEQFVTSRLGAFKRWQTPRWRSSPVSLMSAYPATMSRGTRRSVTQCVASIYSFSFFVHLGTVQISLRGLTVLEREHNQSLVWHRALCSCENRFPFSGLQSDGVCWTTGVVRLQAICRVW